jgi:hypothetical protein
MGNRTSQVWVTGITAFVIAGRVGSRSQVLAHEVARAVDDVGQIALGGPI